MSIELLGWHSDQTSLCNTAKGNSLKNHLVHGSSSKYSTATWMSDIYKNYPSIPLCQIVIPGSHDSATDHMTKTSPYAHFNKLHRFNQQLVCSWAKTQYQSVYSQLLDGIRYLDLRIENCSTGWKTFHGLISNCFLQVLDDIANFAIRFPREIVLVDFQHLVNFDFEDHIRLIEYCITHPNLGTRLAGNHLGTDGTLLDFWRADKNVIIFYDEGFTHFSHLYWKRSEISNPWHNTPKPETLSHKLLEGISQRENHKFYVSQLILTPDAYTVVSGLWSDTSSLFNLTIQSIPSLITNGMLEKLDKVAQASNTHLNIVIVDFYEHSPFVDKCLDINTKNLPNSGHWAFPNGVAITYKSSPEFLPKVVFRKSAEEMCNRERYGQLIGVKDTRVYSRSFLLFGPGSGCFRLVFIIVLVVLENKASDIMYLDSQDNFDTASWMYKLYQLSPMVRINRVVLPGTHDSATDQMTKFNSYAQFNKYKKISKSIVCRWSKTQSRSVYHQLMDGIRYLDFRIEKTPTGLKTFHGLSSNCFYETVNEIARYVNNFEKEIVILDFQHLVNFKEDDHRTLAHHIINHPLLSSRIAGCNLGVGGTFHDFWAANKNVIILYNAGSTFLSQYFHHRSNIENPWYNKPSSNKLVRCLAKGLSARCDQKLHVSQLVLTPRLSTVVKGFVSSISSLYRLTVPVIPSLIANGVLDDLNDEARSSQKYMNIVIVDFYEQSSFVSRCLEINAKNLLKHSG